MSSKIVLKYKNGAPLNAVADFIFLEKARLLERLDKVDMVTGASTLFGSGEDKIITIILQYTDPSEEDLADINDIVAIAKNYGSLDGASKIDIQIDGLENQ
ncbi:MAG: hypothetical protein JKY31_04260 [Rhodobacteraceae bacterium]|nr:hypothetical protein [Paracoccaceae bacterium]